MTHEEEQALVRTLLDDAVVSGASVSGLRRGRSLVVSSYARHWEVVAPVELRDRAFRLLSHWRKTDNHPRDPAGRSMQRQNRRRVYFEGAYYDVVSAPDGLVRAVVASVSARWGGGTTEVGQRLALESCIAEDGAVRATFPYHYYRVDRELIDAALELVLSFVEALDEAEAGPATVSSTALALAPYRSAALQKVASGPPALYVKEAKALAFVRGMRKWRPLMLVIAYASILATFALLR